MLWVKKYNLSRGKLPYHSENFHHAENLELLFCSTAFVDKIIKGNIIYFISLQFIWEMSAEIKSDVRHKLFSQTFPFLGKATILQLIWGNIGRKRERSAEITSDVRNELFSRIFPFLGKTTILQLIWGNIGRKRERSAEITSDVRH